MHLPDLLLFRKAGRHLLKCMHLRTANEAICSEVSAASFFQEQDQALSVVLNIVASHVTY